jgi:hypothetical protein
VLTGKIGDAAPLPLTNFDAFDIAILSKKYVTFEISTQL